MEKSYIIIYNIPVDRLEENLKNNNINRYIILNNTIVALYVESDSMNEVRFASLNPAPLSTISNEEIGASSFVTSNSKNN